MGRFSSCGLPHLAVGSIWAWPSAVAPLPASPVKSCHNVSRASSMVNSPQGSPCPPALIDPKELPSVPPREHDLREVFAVAGERLALAEAVGEGRRVARIADGGGRRRL